MADLSPDAKTALTATVARWRDEDLADYIDLERGRPGRLELLLEPQTEQELARASERFGNVPVETGKAYAVSTGPGLMR